MSSKNSISRPLDYVAPFAPKLNTTVIDINDKNEIPNVEMQSGIKLVNAMAFVDNKEQIISDKDLQTMATNNITDISEYGELTSIDTNDISDASTFPTIPTGTGTEISPIVDNVNLDTKEIKAKK